MFEQKLLLALKSYGSASNITEDGSMDNEYWQQIINYFKQGSEQSCELLGSFGITLQLILFFISFSTLLIKRSFEKPQRPWKIFLMDASKQIFSAGLLHTYNIISAWFLSNGEDVQCQWYFINFCIDILGVASFSYLLLSASQSIMKKYGHTMELGNYGLEKDAYDKYSKLCILIIILAFQDQWLYLGIFLLYPIQKYPRLLLLVVMVLVPVGFNSIQFWIIDEFIKSKKNRKSNSDQSELTSDDRAEDLQSYDIDEEYEKKLTSRQQISLKQKSLDRLQTQNIVQNYGTIQEEETEEMNKHQLETSITID